MDLSHDRPRPARMWLRRVELDAMLTRELRKIPGCQHCSIKAGPALEVTDFDKRNWQDFEVMIVDSSLKAESVRAIAGGCVSQVKELYNVVD